MMIASLIIDSGSSEYLTNDRRLFKKLLPMKQPMHISVAEEGESETRDKLIPITPKNVLFILEARINLLSIRKMDMAALKVVFSNGVVPQERRKKRCPGRRFSWDVVFVENATKMSSEMDQKSERCANVFPIGAIRNESDVDSDAEGEEVSDESSDDADNSDEELNESDAYESVGDDQYDSCAERTIREGEQAEAEAASELRYKLHGICAKCYKLLRQLAKLAALELIPGRMESSSRSEALSLGASTPGDA
ncbi:AAEL010736-PA [Aedes aegypti]|uniref:AAEL010736-PA n=1 Tax=Aedes aegypti TaxID=7159 RepID=Q16S10_AEDAE|nr:AAEL010736-PA [Aedes aegypti]